MGLAGWSTLNPNDESFAELRERGGVTEPAMQPLRHSKSNFNPINLALE